jgi:Domain of unknown function DUF1828
VNPAELEASITGFLSDEIHCELVDGRLACVLPFAYPDGDSVVVYVSQRNGGFEITDYGEAIRMSVSRPGVRMKPLAMLARTTAANHGVSYGDGRFAASAKVADVADVIWRVGQASSELSHSLTAQRPEPDRDEPFADEIERELKQRDQGLKVERDTRLEGASGHVYRPALYLPEGHTILEPIAADGAWNAATSVYVEFGDLGRSNGYSPIAVIDDRDHDPEEQILQLLVQVGDIARWSERPQWLGRLLSR